MADNKFKSSPRRDKNKLKYSSGMYRYLCSEIVSIDLAEEHS